MLKLLSAFILFGALSAAALSGAPAPTTQGAGPVVTGSGHWLNPVGDTIGYQVSVVELPNGSVRGQGLSYRHSETLGNAWFHFDVADYLFIEDQLFVIGVITQTFNTPGPGDWVGTWTILAIQDNGAGQGPPDRATAAAGIPAFFTLEQIIQFVMLPPPVGPGAPETWPPLTGGNFQIH